MKTEHLERREKPSIVDEYEDYIVELIGLALNYKEIREAIERKHYRIIGYQTVRNWIKHERRPEIGAAYDRAQSERRRNTGMKAVTDPADAVALSDIMRAGGRDSDFIARIIAEFGTPDNPSSDRYNNPLDLAAVSYIILCRAIMVMRSEQAGVLALRAAQKIYNEQILFLEAAAAGGDRAAFSGVDFVIDPAGGLTAGTLQDFRNAVQATGSTEILNAEKDYSADRQRQLFDRQ